MAAKRTAKVHKWQQSRPGFDPECRVCGGKKDDTRHQTTRVGPPQLRMRVIHGETATT